MGNAGFKTKGLVYLAAKEYYGKVVPGGLAAFEAALSPELRTFFLSNFIASGWWDVLPIVPLSAVAAKLCGISQRELVIANARHTAERDISGVYRLLLKVASPSLVAGRLPRISMQYFSFGESSGAQVAPGEFRAEQRGVPIALQDWLIWAVEGFAPVALSAAGAKSVSVTRDRVRAELGGETVAIGWTLRWN